jgi:hypothetical protein
MGIWCRDGRGRTGCLRLPITVGLYEAPMTNMHWKRIDAMHVILSAPVCNAMPRLPILCISRVFSFVQWVVIVFRLTALH